MKLHTGDTVVVIAGKDKGKTGKVLRILPKKNLIVVEGVNMRVRHIKKTPQQAGQKIKYEASMHAAKVMIVDPKTKKPARIGYKIDEKGMKWRISKSSGQVLEHVKGEKTGSKTERARKVAEKKGEGEPEAKVSAKQPFWKKMGFGSQAAAEDDTGGASQPEPQGARPQAPARRSRESS